MSIVINRLAKSARSSRGLTLGPLEVKDVLATLTAQAQKINTLEVLLNRYEEVYEQDERQDGEEERLDTQVEGQEPLPVLEAESEEE